MACSALLRYLTTSPPELSGTKQPPTVGLLRDSTLVLTEDGLLELAVPRDRNGSFEPVIVPKGERRLGGFDERILSLYARGMTVREIRGHLQELYRVEVSPDLIRRVTDAVLEEVRDWQSRPLNGVYPVVLFDALRVKIRDEGLVRNKAVYLALAIAAVFPQITVQTCIARI